MNTFILNAETGDLSIRHLLQQAQDESLEVKDTEGNVLAIVFPSTNPHAAIYAEAQQDALEHRQEIETAMERRGGLSTAELLAKAASSTKEISRSKSRFY